jgi:hypothetical protein
VPVVCFVLSYPIHFSVIGGNLNLVKWLSIEHWCPLRVVGRGRKSDGPLLSSKGRSPLGVALSDQKLDIVHFLVAEMKMSFYEESDLATATTLANFTCMLRMVPNDFFVGKTMETKESSKKASSSSPNISGHSSSSFDF